MPYLLAPIAVAWLAMFGPRLTTAVFGCAFVVALFYCAAIRNENSSRKVLRVLATIMVVMTVLAIGLYFGTEIEEDGPKMCGHVQC
jgi:nucleoside recognition membrane protein YjiH